MAQRSFDYVPSPLRLWDYHITATLNLSKTASQVIACAITRSKNQNNPPLIRSAFIFQKRKTLTIDPVVFGIFAEVSPFSHVPFAEDVTLRFRSKDCSIFEAKKLR